jgi:ribonuclease J
MVGVEILQANQIGGCVTVISSVVNGVTHRIMIDYGCSLEGSDTKEDVKYLWDEKPIDAVFFTHYHGDHVGRIMEIPEQIPLYMGETARQVMINIQEALSKIPEEKAEIHKKELAILKDDDRVHTFHYNGQIYERIKDIPGFTIEPYSVDHSAYDAYMFLIEADTPNGKKVILHTGDFRGHGRRGKAMLPVINHYVRRKDKDGNHPKRDVDILITEGTMMNRGTEQVRAEVDLQIEAARYLRKHKYAFLICSSTNLDSLASFYQAAQMAAVPFRRYLYTYSNYYAKQLKTFSETAGKFSEVYQFDNVYALNLNKELSSPKWKKTMTQKELMERTGFLATIKPEERYEKYIDAFMQDFESGKIEEKPVIIYSMWDGYVDKKHKARKQEWIEFLDKQEKRGIEIKHLHTSGHATVEMIEAVITAVDPKEAILPMHTENAKKFKELAISDALKERVFLSE